MIQALKDKVKELLKNKQVELFIGYQRASDGVSARPAFIESESDVDTLIWDAYCIYNLSGYLKDYPESKIGIIAKKCDLRSIAILLQENQSKRENLFIIEVECQGVIDEKRLKLIDAQAQDISFSQKCKTCPEITLTCDYLLKDKGEKKKTADDYDEYEPIRKMEAKAISERLKFWEEEFSRCIRCYACSKICPMCYCPVCVANQAKPFWFSKATGQKGNFAWNVTRAIHLAGRCIDCGECERACRVGIPLRDINKKIEKDVKELFHYEAGTNPEMAPLFACFDKSDPDDFIK